METPELQGVALFAMPIAGCVETRELLAGHQRRSAQSESSGLWQEVLRLGDQRPGFLISIQQELQASG